MKQIVAGAGLRSAAAYIRNREYATVPTIALHTDVDTVSVENWIRRLSKLQLIECVGHVQGARGRPVKLWGWRGKDVTFVDPADFAIQQHQESKAKKSKLETARIKTQIKRAEAQAKELREEIAAAKKKKPGPHPEGLHLKTLDRKSVV